MSVNPVITPPRSVTDAAQTLYANTTIIILADFIDDIEELEFRENGTRTINLDDFLERPIRELRPSPTSITVTIQQRVSGTWGDVMNMEIDTELIAAYLSGSQEIQLTIPDITADVADLRLVVDIEQPT